MQYKRISREEYMVFHLTLNTDKEIGFSKKSMLFWDKYYDWETQKPYALIDEGKVVSVSFVNFARYRKDHKVFSIVNIFTPSRYRGKGYAKELMKVQFKEAYELGCKSFRLNCEHEAIPFYDKIGMCYWGWTKSKALYVDLPMPIDGDIENIKYFRDFDVSLLFPYDKATNESKLNWIARRIKDHESTQKKMPDNNFLRYQDLIKFIKL